MGAAFVVECKFKRSSVVGSLAPSSFDSRGPSERLFGGQIWFAPAPQSFFSRIWKPTAYRWHFGDDDIRTHEAAEDVFAIQECRRDEGFSQKDCLAVKNSFGLLSGVIARFSHAIRI